ncbi:MAG: hypothetical protein ACOCV2_04775, partial [Persicimonas sp.]
VVEGSVAYRTIIVDQPRSRCNSRLEVIDLSQPHDPDVRTTRDLKRPRGLATHGKRLFVADEKRGVRVFDTTDPVSPEEVDTWDLDGVKDLVIDGFDMYAMTSDEIQTFYIGRLFENGADAKEAAGQIEGVKTVVRAK